MSLLTRGQINQLLWPALKTVWGESPTYPPQWVGIFKEHPSDKWQEVEVEMRYLEPAMLKPEGTPTRMGTMGQRSVTNYIHRTISLGFQMSMEAIQDDLYKTYFPQQARALRNSMVVAKNVITADVFNNGFDPLYPIGDGEPLYSRQHPIDNGVVANTHPVPVAFSMAALEAALVGSQQFRAANGVLVQYKALKLVVPPALQFKAAEFIHSGFSPENANNHINPVNFLKSSYLPEGYQINQYFTDPTFYTILTNCEQGFKIFNREAVQLDSYVEFLTGNFMAKAVERYAAGVTDFRAAFGGKAP